MSKTIYTVRVPDSVSSHTAYDNKRETSLLDNESEEDKRLVTLLLSFQWRSVETRETASGDGDEGEGQTGTGTGSASSNLYALEASLDGSPFKSLLHAHIPVVLHSKERQVLGTGPHHPHHTRNVIGSSLDVFAPIEWVYDDDTEIVTMPISTTTNNSNDSNSNSNSTVVKPSAYKTINSLSPATTSTKQHSDQWGFHCTESECPAPWLVSEVLILEAGEGRDGHLMDSDIAGAFRHFQHRHQTLLSASPSASYSVLTSGSNSSVTLTRDPHTPKPRTVVTASAAVSTGNVALTTMRPLTTIMPFVSTSPTSTQTDTIPRVPPPDPANGLITNDKITSLTSSTSDRHIQQLISEHTDPLPVPFPLAPYVDTRTYTRSPALKPAPIGAHFTGATDTEASTAHQACLPFTTSQVDAYIPPSGAIKESVEKWRTAVTALTNRIRAKKLGGNQLLDYLRKEAAVLQRLRDELFCP